MKEARERATEAAAETEGTATDGRAAETAAQAAVETATTTESGPGADVVGVGGAAGSEWLQWGGVERGGVGVKTD